MNTIKNPRSEVIPISLDKLNILISEELNISISELNNTIKTKRREVTDGRKIGIYLGYTHGHATYKQLERTYNISSNKSIDYALETTNDLVQTNSEFREKFNRITERIMYECFPNS